MRREKNTGTTVQNELCFIIKLNGYTSFAYARSSYMYNDKIVYYTSIGGYLEFTKNEGAIVPYTNILPGDGDMNKLNWTIAYGNDDSSGKAIVPVQWMRSDGDILEDTFKITVSGDDENNTNSGTSDSGSGHTSGGF